MGMGVSFICKDCNHEESFFTGIGMADFSLEAFFNGENKRDYNRILNKIESRNTVKKGFVVFLTNKKAVFKQTKSSSNKEFVQKFHELVNKDNKNNHKWQDCEFKDNQECRLLVVEVKDKLK